MKDIQQLIKRDNQEGKYKDIFPQTYIEAISDKQTGVGLDQILNSFNMYFLNYLGDASITRLQVIDKLRRQGLWITYVTFDNKVIIEWYNSTDLSNTAWANSSNWMQGNNMLVGDITISSNGTWVINGEDTGIPARGEQGITPILRVSEDNRLEVSYNEGNTWNGFRDIPVFIRYRVHNNKLQESVDFGKTWEDVSDYIGAWFRWNKTSEIDGTLQISRDEKKTWEDISPVIATDIITNSEDIVKNDSKELEFANKEYNPEQFSGLGRVYLRKNIVDGKNILTQEMINKPNTRYIIQYDYDLNQEEITIPENCTLDFQGGSLYNGTVVFNNTNLKGLVRLINIDALGSINNTVFQVDWLTRNLNNNLGRRINRIMPILTGVTLQFGPDVYTIEETLNFDYKYYTIKGTSAGYNQGERGSTLQASSNFKGDFLINFTQEGGTRSVIIENMHLSAQGVTGGICGCFYDASSLRNINITGVGKDNIGLYLRVGDLEQYNGVTQTSYFENIFVIKAVGVVSSVPSILCKKVQESTFINVKAFVGQVTNDSIPAAQFVDCRGSSILNCSFCCSGGTGLKLSNNESLLIAETTFENTKRNLIMDSTDVRMLGSMSIVLPKDSIVVQGDSRGKVYVSSNSGVYLYDVTGQFVAGNPIYTQNGQLIGTPTSAVYVNNTSIKILNTRVLGRVSDGFLNSEIANTQDSNIELLGYSTVGAIIEESTIDTIIVITNPDTVTLNSNSCIVSSTKEILNIQATNNMNIADLGYKNIRIVATQYCNLPLSITLKEYPQATILNMKENSIIELHRVQEDMYEIILMHGDILINSADFINSTIQKNSYTSTTAINYREASINNIFDNAGASSQITLQFQVMQNTPLRNSHFTIKAISQPMIVTKSSAESFILYDNWEYTGMNIITIPAGGQIDLTIIDGVWFGSNIFGNVTFAGGSVVTSRLLSGDTRPVKVPKGFTFFDNNLNKIICWNGTAWINFDGTPLS